MGKKENTGKVNDLLVEGRSETPVDMSWKKYSCTSKYLRNLKEKKSQNFWFPGQMFKILIKIITAWSAFHKVIIFCKSHPLNWQLEGNNQQRNQASSTTMTTRLHDTSLKGASE